MSSLIQWDLHSVLSFLAGLSTSSYQPDNYALPDQPIRKTSAMATREVKSSLAEIAIIIILIILLKSGENGENISWIQFHWENTAFRLSALTLQYSRWQSIKHTLARFDACKKDAYLVPKQGAHNKQECEIIRK